MPALRDQLNKLQEVLDDPQALDTEEIEILSNIHSDLERILESTQEVAREQHRHTLRERLEGITQSGSALTRILGSLADVLSGMGI